MVPPIIRSMVQIQLPRYFDGARFLRNKLYSADAVVIQINGETEEKKRKRAVIQSDLLVSAPFQLLIGIHVHNGNNWREDVHMIAHENVKGFVFEANDWRQMEALRKLLKRKEEKLMLKRDHFRMYPIIRNPQILDCIDSQRIDYAILRCPHSEPEKLTNHDENDMEEFISKTKDLKIRAIGTRACIGKGVVEMKRIESDFRLLKSYGFNGFLIHSKTLIPVVNCIFREESNDEIL